MNRVSVPEAILPFFKKNEKVDQDEVNWVWDTTSDTRKFS